MRISDWSSDVCSSDLLCGRPAALVTFLEGLWPRRVHSYHCAGLGGAMARMHLAGADFALSRANALSVAGWRPLLEACAPRAATVRSEERRVGKECVRKC